MKKWYKLNNIGKFYAFTANIKNPKIFRLSAILEHDIEEEILQQALDITIDVYRNFNVNLRRGIFCYYLEESSKKNEVSKENLPICFKLYNNSDDFLYRVSYFKNKINFEISHILSDGRGSSEFFKLLLTNYINIKLDLKIDTSKNNKSLLEKTEDSFNKYYKKTKTIKKEPRKIYTYKGKMFQNQTRFMECHMNVNEILDIAHKYNTTLTGLLVSVLIYSFKDEMSISDMEKYIKIDIPVDLRRYFKSYSSMNFVGLTDVMYKFSSKNDTLENVIIEVKKQLKEKLTEEKISEIVNSKVALERKWYCRITPIFIKNIIINICNKVALKNKTTCLSNIGIIKLETKVEKEIKSFSMLTATADFQFCICTFKNDLCIGMASNFINNDVIKNFCRFFSNRGIELKIDGNEVE